ncbi:MAG TPA: hypothetical protein DCQ06_02050 [Myxococcales bacterium]|nr:hypothetical protein [Myxococcales bacterium]
MAPTEASASVKAPSRLRQLVETYNDQLPLEQASLPPAEWYTDPQFDALEGQAIWRRHWLCAGPVAALSDPGTYLTGEIAGQPWVVVRGDDGEIRAFWNVCRHQGAVLVDGQGELPTNKMGDHHISCPYHGWSWQSDGSLRHAPKLTGIDCFDRASYGMWPLHVAVWGAIVMVAVAEHRPADPPQSVLEVLNATQWQNLHLVNQHDFVVESNWKVFIDNYLDGGYHVPVAHAQLASGLDGQSYALERGQGWSIQRCGSNGTDGRVAGVSTYAWLYPSLCINRYGDWLDLNIVEPVDARRCRVRFFWLHVDADLPKDELQSALQASHQVQDEDAWLCKRVQIGKSADCYQPGRYAPRLEPLEYDFHHWLKRDYLESL